MQPTIAHPKWFPAYYPATARPKDAHGQESGAAGAIATFTFDFPTRPHLLTAFRIYNVWRLPDIQIAADEIDQLDAVMRYIDKIGEDQLIATQFTQSDIVVKPAHQRTVIGGGVSPQTVHWHPLVCPYELRGGNKVTVTVERLTSYPTLIINEEPVPIIPTIHCTWETIVGVEGAGWYERDWGVPTMGMMPGQDPTR